jgi:hypothetical protein
MRQNPAAWWRLPTSLALIGLGALVAWLVAAGTASASTPPGGQVFISPSDATVGAGGTTSVDLVVDPPDGGLTIWIVEVAFDTNVVQVDESSGFNCEGADLPGGGVGSSLCEGKNNDGDPEPDSAVALGAYLRNEGGTPVGLTEQTTLATIHFDAVGEVGECSNLTITVSPANFLKPDGGEATPTIQNPPAEICITAGQTVLWGDVNCNGSADPVDGLFILRADAGLPTDTGSCPDMGEMVTVAGQEIPWGDLNCSESADPVDGLLVLRFDAGLPADTGTCPDLGTQVSVS